MGEGEISQLRLFLEYGPIGIAGLTLVLAIIGIMAKDIGEHRYKLFRLVLIFGAFSLVALLTAEFFGKDAEHDMRVQVFPHDNDGIEEHPEAFVQVNAVTIDRSQPFSVQENIVVSVDVNRAIAALSQAEQEAREAKAASDQTSQALREIVDRLAEAEVALDDAQAELVSVQSSGGLETLRLTTDISSTLQEVSRSISVPLPDMVE